MTLIRSCPVCNTSTEDATLFLEESIDQSLFSGFSYASRKEPEYMCHRLVRCSACELIYASNPPEQAELAQAYHIAEYDSSDEANDAALSYIRAISPILTKLKTKASVLEIGSGTGVFLELLKKEGFTELVGVEPSSAAIRSAPEHRREWLRMGIFDESAFKPASFDLICCFMTMEHIRNPMDMVLSTWRILKPGGVFVTVTHDYGSMINRLLGKKSPIIDIEHMQLFSKQSVYQLFESAGYADITVESFVNTYSLRYWMRLAPIPHSIKSKVSSLMAFLGLDNIKLGINVGNLVTTGIKRA